MSDPFERALSDLAETRVWFTRRLDLVERALRAAALSDRERAYEILQAAATVEFETVGNAEVSGNVICALYSGRDADDPELEESLELLEALRLPPGSAGPEPSRT